MAIATVGVFRPFRLDPFDTCGAHILLVYRGIRIEGQIDQEVGSPFLELRERDEDLNRLRTALSTGTRSPTTITPPVPSITPDS